jgi:hypothetical protein
MKKTTKEKNSLRNYKSSTYVCAYQGGCVLILEKVPTKGTHYGKDQCNYAFGRFPRANWPISITHMAANCLVSSGDDTST